MEIAPVTCLVKWFVLMSCASAVSVAQGQEAVYGEVFCETRPDLNELRGQSITDLRLWKSNIKDISPLKGLPITKFVMFGCPVEDLSPLAGMPLESVWIGATKVSDFSPLKGPRLKDLRITDALSDLSFLEGMNLRSLELESYGSGNVTDLRPLKGMKLEILDFEDDPVTEGMDIVREMKSLQKINGETPKEFWRNYDAEAPARNRLKKAGIKYRSFWISDDGDWTLQCNGDEMKDLSALAGLPVKRLILDNSVIQDFSPLRTLSLDELEVQSATLSDLSSIKGASLTSLHLSSPKLEDLSPLKGIGLKSLALSGEMIKDLSPLKGMALKSLTLSGYQIVDISALQGMPLKTLSMFRTNVHDLTPLEGVPLEFVRLNVDPVPKGMDVLRRMKTITQINHQEPAMFWKHYDGGKVENLRLPRWMYGWD